MKVFAIIMGVLVALLGVWAMIHPLATALGLGWLLGAILLVNGIGGAVSGFSKKDVWKGIFSTLVALGGLFLLFNVQLRLVTDAMLAYMIASIIVIYGINMLIAAIKGMKASKAAGIIGIVCGVLSIIAGVFAAMHPVVTFIGFGFMIGFWAVISGINVIVLACAVGNDAE